MFDLSYDKLTFQVVQANAVSNILRYTTSTNLPEERAYPEDF